MIKTTKKKGLFPSFEELYDDYIQETIQKLKKYKDIEISAKILHHFKKPTFYYYCIVRKNSCSNPFNINILFCFEFIDGEIPYVTILTDFVQPSLNDNRNYYRCLIEENKYIFSLDNFQDLQDILEKMINGIENFLFYIKESLEINAFIFLGEYNFSHIYQINDFLMNKNYLNFYRIKILNENKNEEKYVIFTKLYFLIFDPLEDDKTLIKLIYKQKLRDLDFSLDNNYINNSLILNFSSESHENLEFILIDREKKIKNRKNEEKKEIQKGNSQKEIKVNNDKFDYTIIIKEWFKYLENIHFEEYNIVITNYKIIFNEFKKKKKLNIIEESKIHEYNKILEFYEKIIEFYENKKDINNSKRIHKFINNIIYICSELIDFSKNKNENENEYLLKIQKYLKAYK